MLQGIWITGLLVGLVIGFLFTSWVASQWRKSLKEIREAGERYTDKVDELMQSYERQIKTLER